MKKENFRLGGYILMILGLIGFISGTGPKWATISVFGLGVILISMTSSKKTKFLLHPVTLAYLSVRCVFQNLYKVDSIKKIKNYLTLLVHSTLLIPYIKFIDYGKHHWAFMSNHYRQF